MSTTVADPTSLEHLFDIVAPPPVPWWPPAPGWFVVGGVLLVLGLWGAWQAWRHWQAAAYRRAALVEWRQLKAQAAVPGHGAAALGRLSELVKRTAFAAFPREAVASLSGEAWLRFLDCTGHTDAFTRGPGRVLGDLAYDPKLAGRLDTAAAEDLFHTVRRWIRRHSTAAKSRTSVTAAASIPSPSGE
jgi:hypothetical protein